MSSAEIAAYLGAAAWVPQIITWIYKLFVKPKIRLVLGDSAEIGYSMFGPIVNMNCAISVEKRDALIRKMEIVLKHEKGNISLFSWSFLNETFSEITSVTGEKAEISKRQPAIALKVGTVALVEKFIGFQDFNFQERRGVPLDKLIEHGDHLKKIHPTTHSKETIDSKELADVIDFFKKNYSWQMGSYSGEVRIYLAEKKNPEKQNFSFSLSSSNIESLNQNMAEIERILRETIDPPEVPRKPDSYNWVHPKLSILK